MNNLNVEKPKIVLQLVHGSCEHALHYQDFANFLNKNGYLVIANDHRSHGKKLLKIKKILVILPIKMDGKF